RSHGWRDGHLQAVLLEKGRELRHDLLDQVAEGQQPRSDAEGLTLEAGEVEKVVDQQLERRGVATDATHELLALLLGERRPVLFEQGSEAFDGGHSRAQLMGDRAEEADLEAVEVLQPPNGLLLPPVP